MDRKKVGKIKVISGKNLKKVRSEKNKEADRKKVEIKWKKRPKLLFHNNYNFTTQSLQLHTLEILFKHYFLCYICLFGFF